MKEYIAYIDEMIAKLQKEEQNLIASDRKDEANLVKIRTNIYGIGKTVYNVVAGSGNREDIKTEYLKKMTLIPQSWKESYEKAKAHDDVEKIVIEEIKLETVEELKNKFLEIYGE